MTRNSGAPGGGAGSIPVARADILRRNGLNYTRRGCHFSCPSVLESIVQCGSNAQMTAILYNLVTVFVADSIPVIRGCA